MYHCAASVTVFKNLKIFCWLFQFFLTHIYLATIMVDADKTSKKRKTDESGGGDDDAEYDTGFHTKGGLGVRVYCGASPNVVSISIFVSVTSMAHVRSC